MASINDPAEAPLNARPCEHHPEEATPCCRGAALCRMRRFPDDQSRRRDKGTKFQCACSGECLSMFHHEVDPMRRFAPLLMTLLLLSPGPAYAKGCLKGAVVGGVAGHYAGHHAVLGAMAGCAIGHHKANEREKERNHPSAG
jgi:hypothetical protein